MPTNKDSDSQNELTERATALARDAGTALGDRVSDQANQLGTKGMQAAGDRLEHAADALADKAKRLSDNQRERGARTAEMVSEKLYDAANYLHAEDAKSMMTTVHQAIVAHPYRTLAAGIFVGWLLAKKR
jgi:ElaB/YqjD/DUF883 family membrane-anchored ribosome-binding protein